MSRRTRRRRERRAINRTATVAPRREYTSPERRTPGRDTFAVAAANVQAAKELPGILYAKPSRGQKAPEKATLTPAATPLPVSTPVPPRKAPIKADPTRDRDQRLATKTCKAKPRSSKGNGSSRPFVPWCDK